MKHSYFDTAEFAARRTQVKSAMAKAGLDLLICADPANMDYLTGFKGWSFYVPQCVLLHAEDEHPTWIGRGQDGAAARPPPPLPPALPRTIACKSAQRPGCIWWPFMPAGVAGGVRGSGTKCMGCFVRFCTK